MSSNPGGGGGGVRVVEGEVVFADIGEAGIVAHDADGLATIGVCWKFPGKNGVASALSPAHDIEAHELRSSC